MSMNGKTKTLKTGKQDYMNLLYSNSDSDSDDKIPDLKLPPIKGKKQRRRKGGSVRPEDSICNIWTLFKSIFVLLCLISFIILSGLSFWSLRRINDLQQQLSELQTSDKETPDMIIKLQNQIVTLNKTVSELKQGMDVFKSSFTLMTEKLNSNEESTKELKASVLASKDYIDAPEKLKLLTNTVATMGSEISDQTKKSEDHDKRLAALEAAKVTANQIPENVDSQSLHDQLEKLQKTVELEFENYTQEITLHSTQISQLENLLKSSEKTGVEVPTGQSSFTEQLSTLTDKVNSVLQNFTINYLPGSIVGKGEFLAFKEDTLSNIKRTNETLFTLSDEFDALAVHLATVDDAIINITSVLNTIKKGNDKETNSNFEPTAISISQAEVTESTILNDTTKNLTGNDETLMAPGIKDQPKQP